MAENQNKEQLQQNVEQQLDEVVTTLAKVKKYFGVRFDPNDTDVYEEMKRQIRKMEYFPNGVKKSRPQLRRDLKANRKRLEAQRKQKKVKSLT